MASSSRRTLLGLTGLALLAAALWAARIPIGTFQDDTGYVLGARRILQTGRLLATYEGDGASAAYFPGFSLLLIPLCYAPRWALQAYSLLYTLATVVLVVLVARRRLPLPAAVLVGASYVLTPIGLVLGTTTMSEVPFAFLFLLCLWWGERKPRWLWLGMLVGLTFLTRLPGLALLPALALGRTRKELALFTLGTWAGGIYVLAFIGLRNSAGQYVLQAANFYEANSILRQQWRFWTGLPHQLATDFLGSDFLTPLAVLILLLALTNVRKEPLSLAVVGYLALCSLWPLTEGRFWLPVWPLILLLAVQRLPRPAWILAGLLLLPLPRELALLHPDRAAWTERRAAYRWLRESTEPGAMVAGAPTCNLEYYSQRTARTPGKFQVWSNYLAIAAAQGADYLMVEDGPQTITAPPDLTRDAAGSRLLERVYASPHIQIYRIRPEARRLELAVRVFEEARYGETDPVRQQALYRRAVQIGVDFPEAQHKLDR